MKILTVVGARPNFMKAAPIIAAIREHNVEATRSGAHSGGAATTIEHILVHTGQHFDAVMSDSFFADLDLPAPDVYLGVAQGTPAAQTAEILSKFDAVLSREKPDIVLLVGDVTSTLACAIATAKVAFDSKGTRPKLAHVEAGLRSFDRSMPEEINRLVTDHVADLFFVTEESGIQNLRNEGLPSEAIYFVGNTMIDTLLANSERAESSAILDRLGLRSSSVTRYGLLTLHRPSNVDDREVFSEILAGLEDTLGECKVVFPVHPRTRQRIREFGLELAENKGSPVPGRTGMLLTDPLGYLDFLCLMKHASVVITDSGGIQEETTCLGVPCVTVRENTERPVTLEMGTNLLAGTKRTDIKNAIERQLQTKRTHRAPKLWDGQAALRIVDALVRMHSERPGTPEVAAIV